jgi:lysophospholipase L1-like esterase
MNHRVSRRLIAAVMLCLALAPAARPADGSSAAAAAGLKDGDYVGVIGDSITEQRLYSLFIEEYLLMCKPRGDLRASQFGWGGETAPGFAARMANDVLPFGPAVATTCFGMNDGGYSPLDDAKAKRYRDGQTSVVEQLKKSGTRFIVVGSPGAVDFDKFRNDPAAAEMYNKTLAGLRDIAQDVARQQGVAFADVWAPMIEAMKGAKAKYGKDYHVCGGDGFHPDRNGHLIMAYAFLKALGCDGDLGTVTVNLAANRAEAVGGHRVLSFDGGAAEVESSRYPFCFFGDPASPSSTSGIIEFFPFNEELNRFRLVVADAPAGKKVAVTWGGQTKEFPAEQVAKGINLAAEFPSNNPFADQFQKVEQKVAEQQGLEVLLVKELMHNLPHYARVAPEEAETFKRVAQKLVAADKVARDASAAAVVPVKHTIKVEVK